MGVAIDSSVLVRYFTKDSEKLSVQAAELLDAANSNSLILDRIIIAEVGYVLRSVYGLSKEELMLVYRSMLADDVFTVPDRELVETTVNLFGKEKPLSFEDCWVLSLKQSGKATDILTFDDDLARRAN